MLNLKRLHYFVEAVEKGTLKEAAHKLNISTQGLLKQMVQLERELEQNLFSISEDHIVVTCTGKDMFQKLNPIFMQLERTIEEIH